MAPRPPDPTPAALAESALLEVGLRQGDLVRYRKKDGGAWQAARVECRERDGSIGVRDERGAARSIAIERLQVRTSGRRGGTVWEAVAERADRDEQLGMF